MPVNVQIPAPLRNLTRGAAEVAAEAADLGELVEDLERRHPGLKARLCDPEGQLRTYVRFFVNGEDVRHLGGKSAPLKAGDMVAIVPAIAGGA